MTSRINSEVLTSLVTAPHSGGLIGSHNAWIRCGRVVAVSMVMSVCGCDDDSQASDTTETLAEEGGDATTGEPAGCVEDDFGVGGPLAGPGWDAQTGLIGEPQAKYYAHTTWIQISDGDDASDKFNEAFSVAAAEVLKSDGLIAVQFGGSAKCRTGRTLGIWRDQAAMLRYVASPGHIAAIAAMGQFTDDADTTSWSIEAAALPLTFEVAIARLDAER